jgi:hypothetical protein
MLIPKMYGRAPQRRKGMMGTAVVERESWEEMMQGFLFKLPYSGSHGER